MMEWLPQASDFRATLRAAAAETDTAVRAQRLAALAGQRLDFLQTIQLDQAARRDKLAGAVDGFQATSLAILASHTVDHVVPGITVAGLRRRLRIATYVAPYGQYRQALLDPGSALAGHKPGFLLFSLSAIQILPQLSAATAPADVDTAVEQVIRELMELWSLARDKIGAIVIQQTFLNVAAPLFGSYDRIAAGAPGHIIARLNERLAQAATQYGVLLLDVARAAEREGIDNWFDVGRWLQAKMEIAPPMAPMYGELLTRVIAAQRGLSKKCLVLDLDNTLWGGVVGDVGIEGIVLGEGSGVGEAHLALQRYARQLRERGVILAVCSKNEESVAQSVFAEHPEMLLKLSDIAVFVANWDDKAANLLTIANRLNIGVDSLVFVDDNPVERARVRESLPAVAVPELPEDASLFVRCLANAGYFEAIAFTAEDSHRAEQYAANASRETLRESAPSLEEFLEGLEMKVVCGAFQPVDMQRVTQLIGKTNQFSVTTKRYSQQDVEKMAQDAHGVTLQFRLIDRFGDNGLVSAMILRPIADERDVLEVDTWIMSCRVFGRQLEHEAMNVAVEAARARGARLIRATYIPTAKNGVVKDLFASLGFTPLRDPETTSNSTRWQLDLDEYSAHATHIAREPI